MRIPPRVLAAVASIATALLLAACGGSDETTESTADAAAIQYGGGDGGVVSDRQPQAKATDRPVRDHQSGRSVRAKKKQGDDEPAQTGKPDGDAGGNDSPGRREDKGPSGCPQGSTAKQCAEAGEALEKSGSSHPVPADECPPALDAAACEEAGKAYAEAEEAGRTVKPDECPRAMTEEQCRIAGEAYAEATN
jgi:hypothetical protein